MAHWSGGSLLRFGALFYTVVLPGIISLPAWYKQLVEFVKSFGFRIPAGRIRKY